MKIPRTLTALTASLTLGATMLGCSSNPESRVASAEAFATKVDSLAFRIGQAVLADNKNIPGGYIDLVCHPYYCENRIGGQFSSDRYIDPYLGSDPATSAKIHITSEFGKVDGEFSPKKTLAFQINVGTCALQVTKKDCIRDRWLNEKRYLFIRSDTDGTIRWSVSTIVPGDDLKETIWTSDIRDENLTKVEKLVDQFETGDPVQ